MRTTLPTGMEYRVLGYRKDGAEVRVTVGIWPGPDGKPTNVYEMGENGLRHHDAEAWRIEREDKS